MNPAVTGIVLLLVGAGLFVAVYALLKAVRRAPTAIHQLPNTPPVPPGLTEENKAILLVKVGGRVVYINQEAREWFGLLEEEPNLERLARRARPSNVFLGLCAGEGQARFSMNGIFVEGSSSFLPYEDSGAILVTLHRPQVSPLEGAGAEAAPGQSVDIFAELSQSMAASLDLKTTLQSVLESVERLIPSDYPEISVWDSENKFLIPYRFTGLQGVDRRLEKMNDRYQPGEGYSGFLAARRQPLLIGDVDSYRMVRPSVERKQYPFNSYVGIPMLLAGELVGTIELASLVKNAFSSGDLEVLRILAGQAAVAVHNALLYEAEQRRVLELSGLAQLAHAAGSLYKPEDLYGRLVETIEPLVEAEILGFWIYDEQAKVLEARLPFAGIPPQFLSAYSKALTSGPALEEILQKASTIVSNNAPEDEKVKQLGLDVVVIAAGIREMVMAPLSSGGKLLGYLLVANKPDRTAFDKDDLNLLEIITGQVAIIIENATLAHQTQRRAQRAEALRRIASLTGSAATLEEILYFTVIELARLSGATAAGVFLLNETTGDLHLHMDSLYGIMPEQVSKPGLNTIKHGQGYMAGQDKMSYITGNAALDPNLRPAYLPLLQSLELQSAMFIPLVVRERGLGELLLASPVQNFFDRSDVIMIDTAAGQMASAIERNNLYGQTDDTLRQRVDQLTAMARINRELNAFGAPTGASDLPQLLREILEEAVLSTRAECGAILLTEHPVEKNQPWKITYQVGDPYPSGLTAEEEQVLATVATKVIADYSVQQDAARQDENVRRPHAGVGSALMAPIATGDNVHGLLAVHSREAGGFGEIEIDVAQALAIQAAIAICNEARYHEQIEHSELLKRRVDTLAHLLETTQNLQMDQPLDSALQAIADGIRESTAFEVVLVSLYHPQTQSLERAASAGLSAEQMADARMHNQPWEAVQKFLLPEFKTGRIYFVPADQSPKVPDEIEFIYPIKKELKGNGAITVNGKVWDPDDMCLLPLMRQDGTPLGLISVDVPKDGLRPDIAALDSLEIFASQAELFIESRLKLHELAAESANLRAEIERVEAAGQQSRQQIPVLLHKDLEQTLAIRGLSQRARRLRAALDIGESLNRQPDESSVLQTLGSEIITRMDFDMVLIALPGEAGPRLEAVLGQTPPGVHPDALLGQKNPVRQCLQTGETLLVSNLMESPEWQGSPLLQSLEAKSFVCLPVLTEASSQYEGDSGSDGKVEAALLGMCVSPLPAFTPEDSQLYHLLARQVGIALQNLRLLGETNRRLQEVDLLLEFSRQLGSLDPARILTTLVESALKAIPTAHAGMVALWDEKTGLLVPQAALGYRSNEAMLDIRYRPGEALPGQALASGEAIRLGEVDFPRNYNLPTEGLVNYRNATGGLLPISTLVVPIGSARALVGSEGAYPLGVIVLDNFKATSAFSADDLALVTSLTQQTALTLENARLYQAAELRARQMQALTQVAASITSSLQSSELIPTLLDQVSSILPYDTGTLWLRHGDQLTIQAARGFEDSEERVGLSVALEDSLLLQEMINTGQAISVKDVREDLRFPSLLEARYLSWLGVPLISKGQVSGVIALEKTEPAYYSDEHIQAVTTFAGQAAVALENAGLYEESVQRAQELDQRSERLALLNRLSTSLSGSLDLQNILSITVTELQQALNCSAVSAVILHENEADLEAETPARASFVPHKLPFAPVFDHLKETLGIYSAEDIWSGTPGEQKLPELLAPLADYLTSLGTHGLLITPLVTGSDLNGLLFIHNQQAYRYSAEEVELARTIANQAAIAVQNARLFTETERLFAETRQQSAELAGLFNFGMNISRVLDQKQLIDLSFENVLDLMKADSVVLALKGDQGNLIIQGIEHGQSVGPVSLPEGSESLSQWVLNSGEPLLLQDLQADLSRMPVPGVTLGDPTRSWMGVPLAVRGANIGVISVQSDAPGQFGQEHLRLIGQVGNQLATALDNARLFSTVQSHAASLEQRVAERTEQLGQEHKRTQTLLGIITELSNSLEMDLVLNRTLALINETIGSEHSLIVLVDQDMPRLFLRASLDSQGTFVKGSSNVSMKMDEGIAGWAVSKRQPVMVADLHGESRWESLESYAEPYQSAIAVPLMMGEDVLGALLLFHTQPGKFNNDQFELVEATAKQIAVAINNAQLFNLIRDQAERLGDMLRAQHIETSRSQSILESVADGVLVTDADRVITVFNASAEHILGLKRAEVIGHSLEHFSGLFGSAAEAWMQTIHLWSENPAEHLPGSAGGTYSEQIELEDGRIISVHLAPVHLRNDFLGTVSIFEDITHMIEVDRLKSEFVATVSHELRTPMTSIKGYVEILLMGAAGKLSEQQTHFLEIVKQNTERLSILVNDLLDISRIEAGKVTLALQPVDLLELSRKAVDDLIRRTQEDLKPMDVQLALPPYAPPVLGDPERVRQMLDNLLENAYYYTPENGRILLSVCTVEEEVQVDVQDNGIGILLKDQERIFERFFRGEDPLVLATSGTGLGLSIVRRLIDMHNGRIWFTSKGIPGEGSTFSFTLPKYRTGEITG